MAGDTKEGGNGMTKDEMRQRIAYLTRAINHHNTGGIRGMGRGYRGGGHSKFQPGPPRYSHAYNTRQQRAVPNFRNRTLVLNKNNQETESDGTATPKKEPNEEWVSKHDRHLQLINKEVHNKMVAEAESRKENGTGEGAGMSSALPQPQQVVRLNPAAQSFQPANPQPAKPRELCTRFTATGECRHGNTCKYLHDPNKTAICRDFLAKGICPRDEYCNLSHEPSPHRCPQCMHFLRGNCTNEHCRYSHVNVAPDAAICSSFAKIGYCEKGAECFERHEYQCPVFAKTGKCSDPRCRLPHVMAAGQMRRVQTDAAAAGSSTAATNHTGAAQAGKVMKTTPGPSEALRDQSSSTPDSRGFDQGTSFIPLDVDDAQFEERYGTDESGSEEPRDAMDED